MKGKYRPYSQFVADYGGYENCPTAHWEILGEGPFGGMMCEVPLDEARARIKRDVMEEAVSRGLSRRRQLQALQSIDWEKELVRYAGK